MELASLLEAKINPFPVVELIVFPPCNITLSLSIWISLNPSPLLLPKDLLSLLTSASTVSVPFSNELLYHLLFVFNAATCGIAAIPSV